MIFFCLEMMSWVDEVQKCVYFAVFVYAILYGLFLINLIGRLSSVIIFNEREEKNDNNNKNSTPFYSASEFNKFSRCQQ